jgi:hypothetical protein
MQIFIWESHFRKRLLSSLNARSHDFEIIDARSGRKEALALKLFCIIFCWINFILEQTLFLTKILSRLLSTQIIFENGLKLIFFFAYVQELFKLRSSPSGIETLLKLRHLLFSHLFLIFEKAVKIQ